MTNSTISPATPGTVNAFEAWNQYINEKSTPAAIARVLEAAKAKTPSQTKVAKSTEPKEVKVNDKRVAALRICDANSNMNKGQLAKLIASELEITYANAYFYSSRVWKKA